MQPITGNTSCLNTSELIKSIQEQKYKQITTPWIKALKETIDEASKSTNFIKMYFKNGDILLCVNNNFEHTYKPSELINKSTVYYTNNFVVFNNLYAVRHLGEHYSSVDFFKNPLDFKLYLLEGEVSRIEEYNHENIIVFK